jgi:hypothetical protein
MLLDHSTRFALAFWRAWGRGFQGVLVIQRGDIITGLRLLHAGFDEIGEAGFLSQTASAFSGLRAECLQVVRRVYWARAGMMVCSVRRRPAAMAEECRSTPKGVGRYPPGGTGDASREAVDQMVVPKAA